MNRENTKDRDEIQAEYIEWFIDGADRSELEECVRMQMQDDLEMLEDKELVKEVKHFAPHIVENLTLLISWRKLITRKSY